MTPEQQKALALMAMRQRRAEAEGQMTLEQQKALALAAARRRRAESEGQQNDGTVGPTIARGGAALPEKTLFGDTDAGRSFGQGVASSVMLGLNDEAAAGVAYLRSKLPGGNDKSYSEILDIIRKQDKADSTDHPVANAAGQLTGGVAGGAGLARGGLSLAANAANAGQGLGRVAGMSTIDGALLGAGQGFGSGEGGFVDRAASGFKGGILGGGLGLAAPYAIAGASAVGRPLLAPVMSRLNPQSYTNQALNEGLQRSGQSPDDIANALIGARADNQGVFTVADAMGNSGQRMLSTVTRTPNNERQRVIDALMNRQAGQGRRISNALTEGFGAPMTARQQEAATTALRRSQGDVNYGAARSAAGAVDTMPAIAAIDNVIQPGTIAPGMSETGVGGTLNRFRNMLMNENGDLVKDFDRSLLIKQEMDSIIEQGGTIANLLRPARNALDDQLASSSQPYSTARDTYRQQSQALEAVETGRNAATRGRVEDTISEFQAMRPDQQVNYRSGYVDPLIERTQGAATGVNKARPLINDATAAEFPTFASPGQADKLGRRISREQTMFGTNNQAMGGSRTADNLADAAEANKFDPGVIAALFQGAPFKAAMSAIGTIGRNAQGQPPRVIENIARALMETRPDVARQLFTDAANQRTVSAGRRAIINALINTTGSGMAGRLGAP